MPEAAGGATPYWEEPGIAIYCGDCRRIFGDLFERAAVLLTDPPFGIEYHTNAPRKDGNARRIKGDRGTFLRDFVLSWWEDRPALVFGSAKAPRPYGVRQTLIWDQGGALGMGDLSIPWKPSWQEIYVLGGPWAGSRDCGSVLQCPPVQSSGRWHPNEKPVALLKALLVKSIDGLVIDPFMGAGSTLVAAKALGRPAIGIELEERYCAVAVERLAQGVLPLAGG
jgi:hypothetical protein